MRVAIFSTLEAGHPDPARLVKARTSSSGRCYRACMPTQPAAAHITLANISLLR